MQLQSLNKVSISQYVEVASLTGASIVVGIIRPEFMDKLIPELLSGPFTQAEEGIENVQQKFLRYAFLHQAVDMPYLEQLKVDTESLVRTCAPDCFGLGTWRAVDTVVQKYVETDYLTAHRDLTRHPYLIASFTLLGSATFELLESREGSVYKTLHPKQGDLLLLRAPGLNPELKTDSRPFHRVTKILAGDSCRISVTFRDNLTPGNPIPGFTYHNQS